MNGVLVPILNATIWKQTVAPRRGRVSNFGGLPTVGDQSGFPAGSGTCRPLRSWQGFPRIVPQTSEARRVGSGNSGSAGNPRATCDVAGAGIRLTVRLVRHAQRKRGATDRLDLRRNGASPRPYRRHDGLGDPLHNGPEAPEMWKLQADPGTGTLPTEDS
jgi:hypothetical protein